MSLHLDANKVLWIPAFARMTARRPPTNGAKTFRDSLIPGNDVKYFGFT